MYKKLRGAQASGGLMKRQLLSLVLAGAFAALSAHAAAAQGAPAADARQQVMALLRDWVTAEDQHDAAALARILDDKFLATSGAGQPVNKDTFIQKLTAGAPDPKQSQTLTDETVIVDGDTAVVIGTDAFHRTDGAEPSGLTLRYTITFIRRNARWAALAEHIAAMPR
jgi:ketosteroid isomerase-like protein